MFVERDLPFALESSSNMLGRDTLQTRHCDYEHILNVVNMDTLCVNGLTFSRDVFSDSWRAHSFSLHQYNDN
jgi:hypothetical protein